VRTTKIILTIATLVLAGASGATTIHVPVDQPTITDGLLAAVSGDTVLVACGTYIESDLPMISGVTLRSETGDPDCVTIDGNGESRVILFDDTLAGTRLEGITITGGVFSAGSGLYFWHAVAEVSNCVITGNVGASFGSGVYVRYADSDVTFVDCLFSDNHATIDGGAAFVWTDATATFMNCTFVGNSADRDGGAVFHSYADVTLTSCTFDANSAVMNGAAVTASNGNATLDQCIITGSTNGVAVFRYAGSSLSLTCCNLFGNEGGNWTVHVADQLGVDGNIEADPQYCGVAGSGDYRLQSDSPSAGVNSPCGHMGAHPVGCADTATESATWSKVKSLY